MYLNMDVEMNDDKGAERSWVFWTVVGLSAALALAFAVSLYELICRMKEKLRSQQMSDGGPPATTLHNFTYVVGVHGDRCSSTFDHQITVLKIELLDRFNRYVTSIAVPVFLLKLKVEDGPPPDKTAVPTHPVFIKTMTVLEEQWSSTDRSHLISFQLYRRRPLTDIASARILHDCYLQNAYIVLKYIVVYDPLAQVNFMIKLKDQQIRGVHPCPPTSTQVFPVEKLTYPTEEIRSFMEQVNSGKTTSWCPSCFSGDTTKT